METGCQELISRALSPGDCVRVGRNTACEVVIKCPFVSSLHCEVEVERSVSQDEKESGGHPEAPLQLSVRDLSSNGTWILRGGAFADDDSSKPKKLSKSIKEELRSGDHILLLSPLHKECQKYRLTLEETSEPGKLLLRQLPVDVGVDVSDKTVTVKSSGATESNESDKTSGHKACSPDGRKISPSTSGALCVVEDLDVVDTDSCRSARRDIAPSSSKGVATVESGLKLSSSETASFDSGNKPTSLTNEEATSKCLSTAENGSTSILPRDSELEKEISKERCPICSKLFSPPALILHSPSCQKTRSSENTHPEEPPRGIATPVKMEMCRPSLDLARDVSAEQCPHCLKLFPLAELITHSEGCAIDDTTERRSGDEPDGVMATTLTEPPATARAKLPSPSRDTSVEQCPSCRKLFPIHELIAHSEMCSSGGGDSREGETGAGVDIETRRYDLEPYSPPKHASPSIETAATSSVRPGAAVCSELEQCVYCLKDFPVLDLLAHVGSCPMKDKSKCTIEEQCQHCLQVLPLDELVAHSLNCSHRKNTDSQEAEMERCMHCFKDFPLSLLVEHSRKCTGDMSGPRDRFKGFIPSVHDLDAMTLTVLNDSQMAAVEHVIRKSKEASERVHDRLLKRVLHLGYSEKDLDRTFQWVRREAPIVVHINLDKVLHFLVEDTHYRNQFETRTSGGSTDLRARSSWEDRIFNGFYARSLPVDRVKYGVLNIVGDPRGVRSCYGYGDSFLQLKKVRLRTTFASNDTSIGTVKVSCCEYYGNVLFEYSDAELKAILDVSTRKKSFLRSTVISSYKEVQIHGPVCLSENVECIVVNDRHAGDTTMGPLLDKFVERNKCNLIWMEPDSDSSYPHYDPYTGPSSYYARPATGSGYSTAYTGPSSFYARPATGSGYSTAYTGPSSFYARPATGSGYSTAYTGPSSFYARPAAGSGYSTAYTGPSSYYALPAAGSGYSTAYTGPSGYYAHPAAGSAYSTAYTGPSSYYALPAAGSGYSTAYTGPSSYYVLPAAGSGYSTAAGSGLGRKRRRRRKSGGTRRRRRRHYEYDYDYCDDDYYGDEDDYYSDDDDYYSDEDDSYSDEDEYYSDEDDY